MNCPNCNAELTYVEVMDSCDWGDVTYIQKAGDCSHCRKSWQLIRPRSSFTPTLLKYKRVKICYPLKREKGVRIISPQQQVGRSHKKVST